MTVVLFILAACAAAASEVLLTRANPGVRLPVWRTPPRDPISVRAIRGLAIGLALFGSIRLSDQMAWWWGPVLMVGAFLPAAVIRLLQNSRVPAQPVH